MDNKTRHRSSGMRFSEEELLAIQGKLPKTKNNTSLSDSKSDSNIDETQKDDEDPSWISPRTVKVKGKPRQSINDHAKNVVISIREATVQTSVSDNHLALTFDGARLLTLNEILALIMYQPRIIFSYKNTWKNKINEALLIAKEQHKSNMPEFSDSCLFIGYRRSKKLVDRDGLPACFKYILDDLRNQVVLKEQILKDDNPNLIVDTPCFQYKGQPMVGVRLERINSWNEPEIDNHLLLSNSLIADKIGFIR